ncbi:MAG: DUF4426 domain-containing protein [Pseudomonadales bacterium]
MLKHYCLLLIAVLLSSNLYAEQKKVFGDYDVHYSVITSTFITPEVAKNYGIIRGKNRALVNIAIRKRLAKGASKAQKALVKGSCSDLIHTAELNFKEINQQDAIYYIAELRFNNKEMRTFTIKVQPDSNIAAYTLKFSKTLYIDK